MTKVYIIKTSCIDSIAYYLHLADVDKLMNSTMDPNRPIVNVVRGIEDSSLLDKELPWYETQFSLKREVFLQYMMDVKKFYHFIQGLPPQAVRENISLLLPIDKIEKLIDGIPELQDDNDLKECVLEFVHIASKEEYKNEEFRYHITYWSKILDRSYNIKYENLKIKNLPNALALCRKENINYANNKM